MLILKEKTRVKLRTVLIETVLAEESLYRCLAIKFSSPKTLIWKLFLDTILQSRSLCFERSARPLDSNNKNVLVNVVIKVKQFTTIYC